MDTDVNWAAVDMENAQIRPMPPVTLHAETVLAHLEHSIAFARAHLTQAETDLASFKRILQGR